MGGHLAMQGTAWPATDHIYTSLDNDANSTNMAILGAASSPAPAGPRSVRAIDQAGNVTLTNFSVIGPPSVSMSANDGGDPDLYTDFSGIASAADPPSTIIGFSTTVARLTLGI